MTKMISTINIDGEYSDDLYAKHTRGAVLRNGYYVTIEVTQEQAEGKQPLDFKLMPASNDDQVIASRYESLRKLFVEAVELAAGPLDQSERRTQLREVLEAFREHHHALPAFPYRISAFQPGFFEDHVAISGAGIDNLDADDLMTGLHQIEMLNTAFREGLHERNSKPMMEPDHFLKGAEDGTDPK